MKRLSCVAVFLFAVAATTSAQTFEAGAFLSSSQWSEFDGNDTGIGGRISWLPLPLVGFDAELALYPSDFPDGISFTDRRFEGLFAATIGPRVAQVRPFVKAGAGFLNVAGAPEAIICVAIFPPPLNCALAGGATLATIEIGGGVEVNTPANTFLRADVTQRFLNYPGPTFRDGLRELVDEDFFAGAIRFTIGGGIRF
jgi:hypothetical protein